MDSSEDFLKWMVDATLSIGPLHDPVTWYGINYARTQAEGTSKTKELVPVQPDFPLF